MPGTMGGSVHFTEVAQGLAKLGWEVMVCVPLENGYPEEENFGAIKILRVNMKLKGKTFPILALLKWRKLLGFKPDILMERYVTFGGVCSLLAKKLKKPFVLEVNSPHTKEFIFRFKIKNRLVINLLTRWSDFQFKTASKIISTLNTIIPQFAREKLIEVHWAANNDMFDLRNIDKKEQAQLKRKLNLADGPVAIFLGTFRNWHGVSHLPFIIENTVKNVPDVKFILIGDGNELNSVKDKINRLGLSDYVIFTGALPYKSVPVYMSLGNVGLAPYDREEYPPLKEFGFFWSPLKVFEYMACSMPVITIDIEPLNKLVQNGKRGYVVKEGDYSDFCAKLIELLKNPARCSNMGKSAREFTAQNFSWEKHVNHLNNELIKLVAEKNNE